MADGSDAGLPQAGPALVADLSLLSLGYRLTGFMWIVPLCLLWYDIFLTMDVEVKYFWNRKGGLSSWLFFINRYWPAGNMIFHNLILSWRGVAPVVCTFWFQYTAYSAGVEHMVVGAILVMRIYAIFDCNKRLLVILLVLYGISMVSETILIGIITHRFRSNETLRSTFTGCAPLDIPLWCWVYWIPSVAFESTLFLLAMYKTVQESRGSESFTRPSQLMIVLLTDSLLYFGGVTTVTLLNFAAWYTYPLALYGMFVGWHISIQSILGCRMLLNIRETAATQQLTFASRNLDSMQFVPYKKFETSSDYSDTSTISSSASTMV